MVSFMQEHDFDIKLNNGESLSEVGNRIKSSIEKLLYTNYEKIALFTFGSLSFTKRISF